MNKIKTIVVMVALCNLAGCATTNKDPLEGLNRGIYKFNDVTDRYALQPIAKGYKAVTPTPIRSGINNFFSNLGTLTTIVNDLLQLKFAQAFTDAGRFVINTTFGVAGFVDVASMDNIPKHNEDFGQTLGFWGVGSGPYLVLPILGPSSVRDAGGLVFDTATSDPITYLHNTGQIRAHNQVRLVQLLDKRTQLLDATDLVDNASIDPYAFMRDAYMQRRASLIQDGLVPKDLLQDDFEPAEDEPAKATALPARESVESGVAEQTPSTTHPSVQVPVLVQSDVPLDAEQMQALPEIDGQALEAEAVAEVPLLDEVMPVVNSDPSDNHADNHPVPEDVVKPEAPQAGAIDQTLAVLVSMQHTLHTLSQPH